MKQNIDDDLKEVLMYVCVDLKKLIFYTPQDEAIVYKAHGDIVPQRFTSYEKIREIIYTLQNLGVIKVLREHILPATRHHDDYEWKIEIIRPKLEQVLENYEKEFAVRSYTVGEKVRNEEKVDWPNDFIWRDENTFDLAGEGRVTFMPKADNKIKTYFKIMTDSKGGWVEVSNMSSATGEKPEQVRIKLNQIKKDKIANLGFRHLLTVEPRQDRSAPSAYRLVPYPERNI